MVKPLPPSETEQPALTAPEVAKKFGIPEAAILGFRDYGSHITLVTVDGRKLNSDDKDAVARWKAAHAKAKEAAIEAGA